jgi:hypothetical protein
MIIIMTIIIMGTIMTRIIVLRRRAAYDSMVIIILTLMLLRFRGTRRTGLSAFAAARVFVVIVLLCWRCRCVVLWLWLGRKGVAHARVAAKDHVALTPRTLQTHPPPAMALGMHMTSLIIPL